MRRAIDLHAAHVLAVRVANALVDEALQASTDLDMPTRRGLLVLAEQVQREGARRAGIEPDDGEVLRDAVRTLVEMGRR